MKNTRLTADSTVREYSNCAEPLVQPDPTPVPAPVSFDQLPLALNANQVAAVLGISRAGAYNLMRSQGFPTLFIGKRMVVPKDHLLRWIQQHTCA